MGKCHLCAAEYEGETPPEAWAVMLVPDPETNQKLPACAICPACIPDAQDRYSATIIMEDEMGIAVIKPKGD
jgi:hypothetical protein